MADETGKAPPSIGKPDLSLYGPDSERSVYYRERVKSLMNKETFLLQQWRQRRCYPYSDRALRMIREGRITAALHEYNAYLDRDPKHLLMQWERLVLLSTMQLPSETEAAASEFLKAIPGFGPALIMRAFARAGLASLKEAEADWAAALNDVDLRPEDRCSALGQLCFAAYQHGDFDTAARRCEQVMACKPDDADLLVFYAGLLEKMERWQAAADQWRRIAGMDVAGPVLRRSVLARGVLLQKDRKPMEAFAVLMAAREQGHFDNPEVPAQQRLQYMRMLAMLAEKAGRIDVAVQTIPELPRNLLDDAGRIYLARLYTLRAEPGKVIPVLFNSPAVSLSDEDTLARILDLIRLLDRKGFTATATDLMDRTLPAARLRFRESRHARKTERLWVEYLAAHADISRKHGRRPAAEASLAQLAGLTGKYRFQMDYAAVLLADNRPYPAITVLQRTAGRTDLSPEQQTRAFTALAAALSRCGRHAEAARAWHRAYLLSGNTRHGLYSSESFCKTGDLRSADTALADILQSNPHDREALERRANIQTRVGNDAEATVLFERLLRTGARDYRVYANLGFAYARQGDNSRSLKFLKQAVDNAPYEPEVGPAATDPLTAVRGQIAEMDRPLELTLADSVHSDDEGTPHTLSSSDQWFNRGGGMLEAAFRPARLGYRNGRTLTFTGRMVWPNRHGTLQPEGDSLQAGIGLKYKPLRSTNLLLCSEYLMGIGEDRDNQVLLRIAHSATQLPGMAKRGPASGLMKKISYRHHYTESGRVFGGDGYWFATHETRLGKAYSSGGAAWLLPFGYLLGDGVLRSGSDFFQVEGGGGLSVRWSGAFDQYRGNRREAECLLRGGYVFYTNDSSPGWNVLLGIRISFI